MIQVNQLDDVLARTGKSRGDVLAYLESHIEYDPNGGCWLWAGTTAPNGYGRAFLTRQGRTAAHRMAYECLVGPIAPGKFLDHLCRVRACVNPAHLEAVYPRENTRRGDGPSAENSRKAYCNHGHIFTPANTAYVGPTRWRQCRICNQDRQAAFRMSRNGQTSWRPGKTYLALIAEQSRLLEALGGTDG